MIAAIFARAAVHDTDGWVSTSRNVGSSMEFCSTVMRDAERFLAAIEDQRHDQVFLVVEVTD